MLVFNKTLSVWSPWKVTPKVASIQRSLMFISSVLLLLPGESWGAAEVWWLPRGEPGRTWVTAGLLWGLLEGWCLLPCGNVALKLLLYGHALSGGCVFSLSREREHCWTVPCYLPLPYPGHRALWALGWAVSTAGSGLTSPLSIVFPLWQVAAGWPPCRM